MLALIVAVLLLPGIAVAQDPEAPDAPDEREQPIPEGETPVVELESGDEAAADQIIVKFKEEVDSAERGETRSEEGIEKQEDLDLIDAEVVKIEGRSVEEATSSLESRPEVEYAEPDFVVHPTGYADEARFGDLWGLENTGQPINGDSEGGLEGVDVSARRASAVTQGENANGKATVVAVIDDGVDFTHPDLADRAWKNPGESGGGRETNGLDDDKNGLTDDVNGWDFANNNKTVHDADDYHGTHVAGTIAASANGEGVVGVAPKVQIMALKFLGPRGGLISNAVAALDYAVAKGAKISNNSWGAQSSIKSNAMINALRRANREDHLFVAAAGNDGTNNDTSKTPSYPASYGEADQVYNVLSVAAVNSKGERASFSNYGSSSVDISAPGVSILSSFPERSDLSAVTLSSVGSGKALVAGFGVDEIGGKDARATFMQKAFAAVGHDVSDPNKEIVLVDDDGSDNGSGTPCYARTPQLPDVGPILEEAIEGASNGQTLTTKQTKCQSAPSDSFGPNKTVVWATGNAQYSRIEGTSAFFNLSLDDRTNLTNHLNSGGKLIVTGMDTLYLVENMTFARSMLGLNVQSDIKRLRDLQFAEETFTLNGPTNDSDLHDVLTPNSSKAVTLGIYPKKETLQFLGGTSMATPHATGAAALATSLKPALLTDRVPSDCLNPNLPDPNEPERCDPPTTRLKKVLMNGGKKFPLYDEDKTPTDGQTVTGRIVDAMGTLQQLDKSPPSTPTLDLEAGSDTGASDSDDITNVNKPTFSGEAEADSTVTLYEGDKELGKDKADEEATTNGKKKWSITLSEPLDNGRHTVKAYAKDVVENESEEPDPELTVTIDTAAPEVTLNGDIRAGAKYYYGDVPSEPTCTVDDGTAGSGDDGECTVSGYSNKVGAHTLLTTEEEDIAGNKAEPKPLSYQVLQWTPKGFYSPVDMLDSNKNAVVNTVKAGSTAPVKFQVFKGDKELTDTNSVKGFKATSTECGSTTDKVEEVTPTGSTNLRYDTTDGHFIHNWKTPRDKAGSCLKLTMTTADEVSSLSAVFRLR